MARNRRHNNGFGNGQSVTHQKSKKPFSIYKEKLDTEAHLHYKMEFLHKDLSKADKQKIKDKIRKEEDKLNKRTIIISLILFVIVAIFAYNLISKIVSH